MVKKVGLSIAIILQLSSVFAETAIENFISPHLLSTKMKNQAPLGVDEYALCLHKNGPEKIYLMTSAIIYGPPVSMGETLRSKLVYFRKKGNFIYLFESLTGQMYSDSTPHHKLLARFPIVEQSQQDYCFDFNEGMNRIFLAWETFATDFDGRNRTEEIPLEITTSYLDQAQIKNEILSISQIVRAQTQDGERPLQIKYTFRIYQKRDDFPVKESSYMKKVGFFEAAPLYELGSGRDHTNIMKYDITKPLTYYLSPNTPADFIPAINRGVLYWNKAYGKEIINVMNLPTGVSIHDPGYNIIQWVDWEQADFAYADMQADPLTGEIYQSHVYLTSVFPVVARTRGHELFLTLENNNINQKKVKKQSLKLQGFNSLPHCQHQLAYASIPGISHLLFNKGGLRAESLTRIAQDFITTVVAHEVGHTLGLRHNFAGNLSSNIGPEEYSDLIKHYLKTGEVPAHKTPASTVMDYLLASDEFLLGAKIRLDQDSLDYDRAAIQWGYSNKSYRQMLFPHFCTDGQLSSYLDCQMWDQYSNPIASAYQNFKTSLQMTPFQLALQFFRAKFPRDQRDIIPFDEIIFTPTEQASDLTTKLQSLTQTLRDDAHFLTIETKYPQITGFNQTQMRNETRKFQSQSVETLGGIQKVLFDFFAVWKNQKIQQVFPLLSQLETNYQDIISSDRFLQGSDINGHEVSFDPSEILMMQEVGKKYFPILNSTLKLEMIKTLSGKISDEEDLKIIAYQAFSPIILSPLLSSLANEFISARSDKEISILHNNETISVKPSLYDTSMRKAAIELLSPQLHLGSVDFNLDQRIFIKEQLTTFFMEIVGIEDMEDFELHSIPHELREWAVNENEIITSF